MCKKQKHVGKHSSNERTLLTELNADFLILVAASCSFEDRRLARHFLSLVPANTMYK